MSFEDGTFGKYSIVRKIATGGMADVYLATQEAIAGLRREVVIKCIPPRRGATAEVVEMFFDEARLMARLSHPNIVSVHELGTVDDTPYMMMEHVAGITLEQLIEHTAGVEPAHALRVARELCAGLHYAHELLDADGTPLCIVHRDVSPQNVLLGEDGSVKLIDFGIAKAADQLHETGAGSFKGRYAYSAPEQARRQPLDRRADVHAVGVVLWEMLMGEPLFQRDNLYDTIDAVLKQRPRSVLRRFPDIDPDIDDIIERATAKEADARYLSCAELQDALEAYAATALLRSSAVALRRYVAEHTAAPNRSSVAPPSVEVAASSDRDDLTIPMPPGSFPEGFVIDGEARGDATIPMQALVPPDSVLVDEPDEDARTVPVQRAFDPTAWSAAPRAGSGRRAKARGAPADEPDEPPTVRAGGRRARAAARVAAEPEPPAPAAPAPVGDDDASDEIPTSVETRAPAVAAAPVPVRAAAEWAGERERYVPRAPPAGEAAAPPPASSVAGQPAVTARPRRRPAARAVLVLSAMAAGVVVVAAGTFAYLSGPGAWLVADLRRAPDGSRPAAPRGPAAASTAVSPARLVDAAPAPPVVAAAHAPDAAPSAVATLPGAPDASPASAGTSAAGPPLEILPAPADGSAASAYLTVLSEPPGARLWLDGRETPEFTALGDLPLDPGQHAVELRLKGFRRWERTVDALAGKRLVLRARLVPFEGGAADAAPGIDAAPATGGEPSAAPRDGGEPVDEVPMALGTIDLETTPPATALLGGRVVGRTPLRGLDLPPGRHQMTFVLDDGRRYVRWVRVLPDATTRREFFLTDEAQERTTGAARGADAGPAP